MMVVQIRVGNGDGKTNGYGCKGEYIHGRLPTDNDSFTNLVIVNQSFQSIMNFNQSNMILKPLIRHSSMLLLFSL